MEPKKNLDWGNLLKYHVTYSMPKSEIQNFVNELHKIQDSMLDTVMEAKERQGFPEANLVIKHVMGLK